MPMDTPQERTPGEWFDTDRREDDRRDAEEFLDFLLRRRNLDDTVSRSIIDAVLGSIDGSDGPLVTRHAGVDLDVTQVRTLVLNNPLLRRSERRYKALIARKIRWGLLIMQTLLGAAMAQHGQDVYAAMSQLLSVLGTFDTDLVDLDPVESALIVVAHLDAPPTHWQDWTTAVNDTLTDWRIQAQINGRQSFDRLVDRLRGRGLQVERSGPNDDYVRIRHMVLLVQWE